MWNLTGPNGRNRRAERGSVLLVTIILLAVLSVVAVALIKRTDATIESVNTLRHYEASVSCADGAREMLLSQFRAFNVNPADATLNVTVDDRKLESGHYDQFNVKSVRPLAGAAALSQGAVMGMANRTQAAGLGGSPYVFTVVCTDTTGRNRQTEIEFLIRFGL
jgi:hypothetical protein